MSAASALIELGIALAAAESSTPIPGQCSKCRGYRNPQYSTAQFRNIFCSKECEHEFVRAAVASLSIDDCIRIHQRLEALVTRAEAAAIEI